MAVDRIEYFEKYLDSKPNDEFARYALAMEYGKVGRNDEAIENYRRLIDLNPDNVPAYHQLGILLQKLERFEEAKARLEEGLAAASRTGNSHAKSEIQALLDEIDLQIDQ